MFALVDSDGAAFLRVGEATEEAYLAAGSIRNGRMPYRAVPSAVRTEPVRLREWATAALDVARAKRR